MIGGVRGGEWCLVGAYALGSGPERFLIMTSIPTLIAALLGL